MDSVKISELASVENVAVNDTLPIVNNGETKQASVEQLAAALQEIIELSNYVTKEEFDALAFYNIRFNSSPGILNSNTLTLKSGNYTQLKKMLQACYDNRTKKPMIVLDLSNAEYITPHDLRCYALFYGLRIMTAQTAGGEYDYTVFQFTGITQPYFKYGTTYVSMIVNVRIVDGTWTFVSGTIESKDYYFLSLDNTSEYTPTANYHPATKKYVDDLTAGAGGPTIITDAATAYTITTLEGNYVYDLTAEALGTLMIGAVSTFKDKETTLYFNSGETPTNVVVPASGIIHIGDAPVLDNGVGTLVANTKYIISVLNNRMVWRGYTE